MDKTWTKTIELVTNKAIHKQFLKFSLLTGLTVFVLLSFVFIVTGEANMILLSLVISIIASISLFVFSLLVLLIFFRNSLTYIFSIKESGITIEQISNLNKTLNSAAAILGIIALNPSTAGAGILAATREKEFIKWKEVKRVEYDDDSYSIKLSGRYRDIGLVFCNKEDYPDIKKFISKKIQKQPLPKRRFPLKMILRTILAFLVFSPIFTLQEESENFLLLALLTLCFYLATIWLIPIFGYIVIVLCITIFGGIIYIGLEVYTNPIFTNGSIREYEIWRAEEWIWYSIITLCLVFLIINSFLYIRGKITSALFEE